MTTFDKAIDRLGRIDSYLAKRDWTIRESNPLRDTQIEVFKLQRDRLDEQIARLKRYAEEAQTVIDNKVYTSPFGPGGQQHTPQTKRERLQAQSEYNKIIKAINDLRQLWLQLMEDE